MIDYKFGGASISNIERLQKVINIVKSIPTNENAILVISAMGKTTNALEKVVTSFYNQQRANALSLFDIIKEQHLSISKYLLVQQFNACLEQLSNIFTEIEWLLHDNPVKPFDYYYDQIVCSGELMSSTIFHFYCLENNIPSKWIDVRDVMLTDNNFRDASIDWQV
ncbi:MAG: aspartate kinase, partial [Bacteroidota bacterium]|nr:aspartate kinase [Bacteroidota bacterium]